MKKAALIFAFAIAISLAACGGGDGKSGPRDMETYAILADGNLPIPEVPDSLATPESRAAFVALHFWDAMDWHNHTLSLDTVFMEQNFANFLGILPYADVEGRGKAVASLMKSASSDKESCIYLASVAERYLADPNSPMRSEDIYIIFLNEFLKSPVLGDDRKPKYEYQLEVAQKNRPGMEAADFAMHFRSGKSSTLHKAVADSEFTLLLFYDPDCEHCKEVIGEMEKWQLPKEIHVLAVDVTGDYDRFARTKGDYPSSWQVALATDTIEDEDLYVFPALPNIYLLDKTSRVILKDAGLHTLAHTIGIR